MTTLEFSGRLWAIGRPSVGTGTQLGISFSLDSGKSWKQRLILLLEGQVTVEGVLAQLPRASDTTFWPSSEFDQEATRRDLAEWIIEEQHAFIDRGRSNPDPHRQQESLSAADGRIVEATPYSSHEPGLYMATEEIQHDTKIIGFLSWKVCTTNGKMFDMGWKFTHSQRYTTCTVTLEEPVKKRKDIRDKFPARTEGRFWHKALFEENSFCGTYKYTIGSLTSTIVALRKTYYPSEIIKR
jgi:hypothetical protein